MNQTQVITGAAIALGLFAVWYVWKGPGRAPASAVTPAEQQRMSIVGSWAAGLGFEGFRLPDQSRAETQDQLSRIGVM